MPACARSRAPSGPEASVATSNSASPTESLVISTGSTSGRSCRASAPCFLASAGRMRIFPTQSNAFPSRKRCWPACAAPVSAKRVGPPTRSELQVCIAERSERIVVPGKLFGGCALRRRARDLDAVCECVGNCVADYFLILLAQEAPQSVRIHDVLTDHVGHCFRRNR